MSVDSKRNPLDVEDGELEDGEVDDDQDDAEAVNTPPTEPPNPLNAAGVKKSRSKNNSESETKGHSKESRSHHNQECSPDQSDSAASDEDSKKRDEKRRRRKERRKRRKDDKDKRKRKRPPYVDHDREHNEIYGDEPMRWPGYGDEDSPPDPYASPKYGPPPGRGSGATGYDNYHSSPAYDNRSPPGPYDSPYQSPPGPYDTPVQSDDEYGPPEKIQRQNARRGGRRGKQTMMSMLDDEDGYVDANVAASEKEDVFRKGPRGMKSEKKQMKSKLYRERQAERERREKEREFNNRNFEERERPNCRFWHEGKCHKRGCKGENCPYNHDFEPPPRRADVCKYYLSGFCQKGDNCNFMHGEYPCKYYHTGRVCFAGNDCKFSHDPLTEETKPLVAKFMRPHHFHHGEGDHHESPRKPGPIQDGGGNTKAIPSLFDIETRPPEKKPESSKEHSPAPSNQVNSNQTNNLNMGGGPNNNMGPNNMNMGGPNNMMMGPNNMNMGPNNMNMGPNNMNMGPNNMNMGPNMNMGMNNMNRPMGPGFFNNNMGMNNMNMNRPMMNPQGGPNLLGPNGPGLFVNPAQAAMAAVAARMLGPLSNSSFMNNQSAPVNSHNNEIFPAGQGNTGSMVSDFSGGGDEEEGNKKGNSSPYQKSPNMEVPEHLPPVQQELFRRIQQQQRDNPPSEDKPHQDNAAVEDENWYSSDEEDSPKKPKAQVANIMNMLNPQPKQQDWQGSGSSRATDPSFNIAKMLSAIKGESPGSQSPVDPRQKPSDPRAKKSDPRKLIPNQAVRQDAPTIDSRDTADSFPYVLRKIEWDHNKRIMPVGVDWTDSKFDQDPRVQRQLQLNPNLRNQVPIPKKAWPDKNRIHKSGADSPTDPRQSARKPTLSTSNQTKLTSNQSTIQSPDGSSLQKSVSMPSPAASSGLPFLPPLTMSTSFPEQSKTNKLVVDVPKPAESLSPTGDPGELFSTRKKPSDPRLTRQTSNVEKSPRDDSNRPTFSHRNDPRFKKKLKSIDSNPLDNVTPKNDTTKKENLKGTNDRQSNLDYASPLGAGDSNKASVLDTYNVKPRDRKVFTSNRKAANDKMDSANLREHTPTPPPLTLSQLDLPLGEDNQAMDNLAHDQQQSLKDVFQNIDPTASPFC